MDCLNSPQGAKAEEGQSLSDPNYMKSHRLLFLFLFILFMTSSFLPKHLAHAGINEWTTIGPEGGNVFALAIDSQNPDTIYSGTDEGVFKSIDGGINWSSMNTGLLSASIWTLAINPVIPTIIYTRTYTRVFKSIDGGANWNPCMTPSSGRIGTLAIDPVNPDIIYVGTEEHGVYKSIDGGANWEPINAGLPKNYKGSTYVEYLAINPVDPSIIYLLTFGSSFKSIDGGASWNPVQKPSPYSSIRTLAIDPVNLEIIYAGIGCTGLFEQCGGVYRSIDGGTTWNYSDITDGLDVSTLVIDPVDSTTMYAGTYNKGIFKSTDAGVNWNPLDSGLTSTYVWSLAINPLDPNTVYAGAYGGVFKSTNGGSNWNVVNTGFPRPEINVLSIDPANSAILYAGTKSGVFKTTDGGTTWNPENIGLPYTEVIAMAINPVDTRIVYAGTWAGLFKSTDIGIHWEIISPYELVSFMHLVINPLNPNEMYADAEYRCDGCGYYNYFPPNPLFKSTDGGANWDVVHLPMDSNGWRLAIDPVNPNILYVAAYNLNTHDAGFFKTTDSGENWSSTGLTDTYISGIAIDPQNPSTLYAAAGSRMYKSVDHGASWSVINVNNIWNNVLAIDSLDPNIMYAGTAGVFKSTNGGSNWIAINNGLTDLSVVTLMIDPADPGALYAGTSHGVFKINQVPATQPSNPSPWDGFSGASAISTLTWQACLYAESYDVFFGTSTDPPLMGTTTNTNYLLPKLDPNRTYYWKIVAKTCCGESTPGPIWSFTVVAPSPPTNVSASDGTYANRVEVTWAGSPEATSYTVYRTKSLRRRAKKAVLGTTSGTSFGDVTATPGRIYYYWIKALNAYGMSSFSAYDSGYR